jgi:hypothetical protein
MRLIAWWLDTNVSDDRAASIFSIKVYGKRKVNIDISRVWGGAGVRWVIMWGSVASSQRFEVFRP